MALRLIIQDEEGATTIVPLGEEEITIGREAGNTIQLTEQNVSRQHARLTQGPDGWVLEDLDSYNGIKVNGVPIEAQITLNEGDLVQIGDYHLSLAENAETALNLDRPVTAANSSGVGEVLPPSSGDEAATDSPFAATASAAASPLGSSPLGGALSSPAGSPSTTSAEFEDNEEETKKSGGFGLLLLLLLAVAAGGGYYYFVVLPGQSTGPVSPPRVADAAAEDPTDPADLGGEGPTDDDKGATKTPASAGDDGDHQGVPAGEDDDADAQGDPGDDDAEDDDAGDGGDDALTKTPTKKKPTTTVPKKKKPPKTETPPPPQADPAELLGNARKASLAGNYSQAYKLAKQSYDIARDKEALKLMGVSACSMGDAAKAKSVYAKADAATKKALASLCGNKGVDLE